MHAELSPLAWQEKPWRPTDFPSLPWISQAPTSDEWRVPMPVPSHVAIAPAQMTPPAHGKVSVPTRAPSRARPRWWPWNR